MSLLIGSFINVYCTRENLFVLVKNIMLNAIIILICLCLSVILGAVQDSEPSVKFKH